MRKCLLLAAGLAFAMGATGCSMYQGRLPVATTRPADLDLREIDTAHVPVERHVYGSDTEVTSVLFFPTSRAPRLDAAVEDALTRAGGDVMTRADVYTTHWWFLIGVARILVRGDVATLPEAE